MSAIDRVEWSGLFVPELDTAAHITKFGSKQIPVRQWIIPSSALSPQHPYLSNSTVTAAHTLAPAQDELKMRCHRRSGIILGYIYLCLNIRITHHWNGTFLCLSINEVRLGKYISVSFMCKCRITKYK